MTHKMQERKKQKSLLKVFIKVILIFILWIHISSVFAIWSEKTPKSLKIVYITMSKKMGKLK